MRRIIGLTGGMAGTGKPRFPITRHCLPSASFGCRLMQEKLNRFSSPESDHRTLQFNILLPDGTLNRSNWVRSSLVV